MVRSVSEPPILLVVADDRTGALEVAGLCADAGLGPVDVMVGGQSPGTSRVRVIDLGTRHLDPIVAADRVRAVDSQTNLRAAHKIDSTLRGNWPQELLARLESGGARVLLVPVFPAVGRTCVGGVVFEDGRPVAERAAARDVRSPIRSSRPAELLRLAGCSEVVEVTLNDGLSEWISRGAGIAVCDGCTDDDLAQIGSIWADDASRGTVIAGTAGSIGAAARALFAPSANVASSASMPVLLAVPALVVCGSLHPGARAQMADLISHGAVVIEVGGDDEVPHPAGPVATQCGRSGVTVLVSALADTQRIDAARADAMAALLGDRARRLIAAAGIATAGFATVVIIGGDTAAAVLGDATMSVGGTVAAGMPWFRSAVAHGAVMVTKSGGFGSRHALTELLLQRRPE